MFWSIHLFYNWIGKSWWFSHAVKSCVQFLCQTMSPEWLSARPNHTRYIPRIISKPRFAVPWPSRPLQKKAVGAAPPAKQGYICVDSKQARANHTPNHNIPRIIPPDATRFADTGILGNSHMALRRWIVRPPAVFHVHYTLKQDGFSCAQFWVWSAWNKGLELPQCSLHLPCENVCDAICFCWAQFSTSITSAMSWSWDKRKQRICWYAMYAPLPDLPECLKDSSQR